MGLAFKVAVLGSGFVGDYLSVLLFFTNLKVSLELLPMHQMRSFKKNRETVNYSISTI